MVMVGGVEIAVDLNLEGIEQTLKELEKQFNYTKFGVNVGIDASAYNKLQQDINRVRDRVVVKKICVPIDICDDSINKVERKFYAIKRKLENNPINIKVNYSQQKGGFSGSGSAGKGSGIDKGDIKNIGRDIVDELKALRKDVVSGFGNSVSSTNNTTSAIGPIRMVGSVVSELKTISKNTKKQGLISSLVGSAIDGFAMGAMNKSGAKFSENFNKILTKKASQNIKQTQSKISRSQSNISQLQERKSIVGNIAGSGATVEALDKQIKAEEERIKQLNQELKRLESQLDDSFDFLGGKQLAVKAIRLKKFGDSVAKNVFAFNDLKEVKDVTLDAMGTLFNAFTDEKFYKEMEDTYVDYMQQVEILGKDAKVEQEKAIKRLTGRFDRVSERVSARAIGGTLKSVAQIPRINKRKMLAYSAHMAHQQLPYMGGTLSEKERKGLETTDQVILVMGGVAPMLSKPGQPNVSTTHDLANAVAAAMPNTFVKAVTNDVSNSIDTVKKSFTYGARELFSDFYKTHKDSIDKAFPGNSIEQDMGALLEPHPADRAIQVNIQGFDEDAVKLAIQALNMAKEFPDKKIALLGGSGGGYAVEEAMAIIRQFTKQYPEMAHLGKNIKGGIGLGTPDFNLTGTASPEDYLGVVGENDHFRKLVYGTLPDDEKVIKKIISHLPGGMGLPKEAIRPSEKFKMIPGGDEHKVGLMVGGLAIGEPLSQAASHIFTQQPFNIPSEIDEASGKNRMFFPGKMGSPNLLAGRKLFGDIEAALWHLTGEGKANKWTIDESLVMGIDELDRTIKEAEKGNLAYENGVRLQQAWMSSENQFVRGGLNSTEGKEIQPFLKKLGEEIEKLEPLGYKNSLYKVVQGENDAKNPDSTGLAEGGFRSRKEAKEWIDKNTNLTDKVKKEAEIFPHYGDVLWNAKGINDQHTLAEVEKKLAEMGSSNPLEKQLKEVVKAFVEFQKKDLELYVNFLKNVKELRTRVESGDDSAKTELLTLFKESPFSVVKEKYTGNSFSKKVKGSFSMKYASFPELDSGQALAVGKATQSLIQEYVSSPGTVTKEIREKATELVETYRFLSDSLEVLYRQIKKIEPPPVPDLSLINDPTSFQSLLNLNTQLPEQYQLNPYSSKVLGEGFTGRAIGDMEKGIVVKYPTVMMEDVRAKIGSPLEVEAQEKLGQKGLSPLAIKEATKQGEFFTATLIKGKTLQSIRDTVDSTKLKKVAKLLADIHKEGFVHLDMSLANIMETEAGDLVAIDFANVQRATKELMGTDLETTISRSSLEEDQGEKLRQYYKEYMDQISAVPMPDPSNVTQEVKKVQQTVSSGIAGKVKKYLEDLGKEIYALGLNKTLDKSQAQEAVKRIDSALEGLNRLKEVLPDKIPNSKGRLAPKGSVINGYASLLKQSKSKILAGGDEPINIKLPDFSKLKQNILDGLELDGGDTSQLREFADSITEPAKEKIKENWDIHSPSGFTEWCKNMLIAGLKLTGQDENTLQNIGKRIAYSITGEVENGLTVPSARYNQLQSSLTKKGINLPQRLVSPTSGFKAFSQSALQITSPEIESVATEIPKPSFDWMSPLLLAGQIGTLIAYKDTLIDIGRVSIDVAKEFSVLTNTLNFLSGGVDKGTEKFNQLKEMSNDMGVNFKTVVQSYNQLAASTRNTSLEGAVTDELIKGITQAGVTFGLSSEEIQGSILAISQIAGKGVVSAEELRGQLAERIPGAFQIAARSMKMTEKELYQLMATGQMASTDFLPKFARQLSLESGAGVTGASQLATASINKLNNSIEAIQLKIGSALLPLYTLGVKIATVGVEFANSNLVAILRGMVTGFISLTMASGQFFNILKNGLVALAKWIGLSNLLGKAINMTKGAWIALGKSMAAMMAKSLAIYASIEIGIGIFKVFQAEFGKSTVYDQWANNIESNVDRVNEAIKSSVNSMTQLSQVKPSNQIASSGNWWLEMGENALGLVGMDSRSQLDKAVKKENEKRAKEGKAPVSQAEIQSAIDARNKINRSQLGGGTRQRDKAIVTREKLSRMRDENFYNPIQRVMEQYKFSNAGPLAEIEQLDKKIKGLKAQQAVLDPADVETAQKLTKEIGLAEKAKQDLLGPLDAVEAGLRQSLKDDQEMLDKYNQAIADQNSDDKEKRKAAEEFLRQPGHDPQSMEQVSRDIDQTTTALNNYQREQARSGAVNDTKKLAMAMMELGIAFGSVEKRINAIHLGKLKDIAQLQVKGFSLDQFNDTNTGLRTAEENYNNTQRLLKERKATMKRLETDLALNPTKTASDQLIAAEEEKRGRKLTGEEVNMLADIYAKEGQEQLKQALTAEASLRDERLKNIELEKQSVEDIYNIRQARQAHYLAIYEDAIDEVKQIDQRNLSNAMTGANNQLARGLRSDLGAEDAFNVKTTGMQYIKVQKDIENNALAMKSLQQAYYEGKLSLEQYTTKSRALLTEDAQLKQQLVEQEISYIKAISQARMNALQRIKESRDANTEIANSGRTEAITKNSISKFRTDEFLSNNESLAQAKNGLVEIQNQLKNTNSELSELEEAYASGDLLLNDYVQKKRQLLITQAQQESQLATAEMARMRAIEDYRLAMLDRMRDVSNNKNAILNAEALTQLAQSQMTGQVGDSQASRQSTEIALDNAKKTVEVAKESLAGIQKAYRKKELSAEKYQERLRAINLEIAQANQSVAEQELALWKAKEQEKISILEKSLERQDRLNKLNAIKTKINNAEQLAGMLASGGTSDLTSSIFSNQETNVSQNQLISSLTNKLAGLKGIVNPTKDLQDKILATEQELNEAVLTKRLNLLSQSLEYKKQMLNATQLENKTIENQLNMIDSQHKLQQAFIEITKKRLENEIVSMERIKTLSDEIGSSSIESVQFRSQFDDAIATKRLKTLDIELKANVRNLEIEQHREKLSQRKAENESRLAVIQAKNSLLIANQSGNSDAIALAQQQFQLANESLSTVLQQGQAMNQLHDTQKTKLALEHQGTLQAEKYAKIQDTINSKLKTANSYLDKQKERLDSINELNKAINNSKTNVLEKQTGISDRKIDLYDAINGTEKITDPKQNAVLMKELEAQLKAIGGSTDPEAMYAERLRLEESLANQKMNALVAEQNMQKTLLQIEFDKYELQAQALILQAKMLALQSKGTENEASANQLVEDAMKGLGALQERRKDALTALGINQETERYNQGIENANAINDTRRKSAEAGYRPKGNPAKYPTATGEAGKAIKELLAGDSQRFGYAPSFDLNQAVKGLRGGNGIDIGRVNIPSPSNEPTYTPLNINEELLAPNLTENTERNTKAMYDLSNSIISLTEALVNNKPGLEINAPVANNNPVSTPTGQPTTTGGQQVINNVNYGGVTVISSDPTGDARKVLNDLAKANKNKL